MPSPAAAIDGRVLIRWSYVSFVDAGGRVAARVLKRARYRSRSDATPSSPIETGAIADVVLVVRIVGSSRSIDGPPPWIDDAHLARTSAAP
ncbi:hypothetical protein [Burkholderia pseudomallei]|uniref:hypothetical protein n=1 Tax=Burkholderia pseudomallei TaxID=28450 RepID=UPI00193CBABA|nr:hypothetical protein [Burkholderia pseudomallei]QRM25818.1 hypothetical protein JQX71_18855 [Burkholderia pseudomallei]